MSTSAPPDSALVLEDIVVAGRLRVPLLRLLPGITVVVGENGAGKSTLLDVVAGVHVPARGRLLFDDVAVSGLPPRERARRIASLGQEPPRLDDVVVAARIAQGLVPRRGPNAPVDAAASALVEAVAAELGVGHLLARRLGQLSGGERRRVHVARVLVDDEAGAVVVDEPFAGLDQKSSALLIAALHRRAANRQVVVVSVHDVATALALGGRLLGLVSGAIVVDGVLPEALAQATAVWGDVKVVVDGDYVGVLQRREK